MTREHLRALAFAALLWCAPALAFAQVTQTGAVQTPGGAQLQLNPNTIFVQSCNAGAGGIVGQGSCTLPDTGGGGVAANTPVVGAAVAVATGGTAVTAIAANAKGCVITNPLTTTDEGISPVEPLYVSQVTTATTVGNGSTFALAAGQSWVCIPSSTLGVSVNATTTGHKFSVTSW